MEKLVFSAFLAGIVLCAAGGFDMLYALGFGVLCFGAYSLYRGHSLKNTLAYMWEGVSRLGRLVTILTLVGAMSAVWRQCGTISCIVQTAVGWITPRYFVLWSFVLCSLMSLLVGSSLCTASIMGLILVLMARASGAQVLPVTGAALAGCFFGDRCSPMSSSANLVCTATGTELYGNVRNMLRSCAIPLVLTLLIYAFFPAQETQSGIELGEDIASGLRMHWTLLLPAGIIVLLCLCRVDVRIAMGSGLLCGILLGVLVQHIPLLSLLKTALLGYVPAKGQSSALSGGGVCSMFHVLGLITLSSTYLGIFRATGLDEWISRPFRILARHMPAHCAAVIFGIPVSMICCSQSLSILMMGQLCADSFERREDAALAIEDGVVLTAALIPWNTASAAQMAVMGVEETVGRYAVYLYLLPLVNALWQVIRQKIHRRKTVQKQ